MNTQEEIQQTFADYQSGCVWYRVMVTSLNIHTTAQMDLNVLLDGAQRSAFPSLVAADIKTTHDVCYHSQKHGNYTTE